MDKLDEILKKKLDNEQFSFNDDDWNAAFSQIKSTKKKRGFWFWMSSFLLLLAVGTLAYSVGNYSSKNVSKIENKNSANNIYENKETITKSQELRVERQELGEKNQDKRIENIAWRSKKQGARKKNTGINSQEKKMKRIKPAANNYKPKAKSQQPETNSQFNYDEVFGLKKGNVSVREFTYTLKPINLSKIKPNVIFSQPKPNGNWLVSVGFNSTLQFHNSFFAKQSTANSQGLTKEIYDHKLNQIENGEKLKPTFQHNLTVNIGKGRFGLSTGMGVGSYSETIKYNPGEEIFNFDTSYAMVNPDFQVGGKKYYLIKRTIDSTYLSGKYIKEFEKEYSNTIKYFEIPLQVYYIQPITNKLDIQANIGGSLQYAYNQNTSYINNANDGLSSPDRPKNILNFKTDLQVNYAIFNNVKVYTTVGYRRNNFKYTDVFGRGYNTYNVGLGLNYLLQSNGKKRKLSL